MIRDQLHALLKAEEVDPAAVTPDEGWHMDIRFVDGPITGARDVCLFRARFEPGAYHERHRHPNAEEIYYIISGRAAVGAGETEHVAEAGSVQFVAKGAVHWFRNLDDAPLELVGVYVGGATLEEAGYEYVGPIDERHRQVS